MSDAIDLKHALPLPAGFLWCAECGAAVQKCSHRLWAPMAPPWVPGLLLVAERVREACARVADAEAVHGYPGTCHDIANRIRTDMLTLPELP